MATEAQTNANRVNSQKSTGPKTAGTRPARRHKGDLKKQSQFAPALMGATSCVRRDYGDELPAGAGANKAKQSQSQESASDKGARKRVCRKVSWG